MKCPKCAHEFKAPPRAKKPGAGFPVHVVPVGEVHAGQRCAFDACRRVIEAGDECYASSGGPEIVCMGCANGDKCNGVKVESFSDYSQRRVSKGARDLIRSVAV